MKKYLIKCKTWSIAYGTMEILVAVANVLLAYVFQFIVAIAAGENEKTIYDGVLIIALYLLYNVGVGGLFYFCKEHFRSKIMWEMKNDVFNHFMGRKFSEYYKSNTGEYISILNNDLKMIEEKAILPIFNTIQHTATLILAFYSIWRVNSLLAPILLLVAIITMFFGKIYSIGLSEASEDYLKESAEYQKKIKDFFQGFEVIQNFGILHIIQNKHTQCNHVLEERRYKSNIRLDRASVLSNATNLLIQCSIIIVCAGLALKGQLTISQITLMSSLTNQLFYPVFQIIDEINCYRSTRAVRKKIQDITQEFPKENYPNAAPMQNNIRFDNVTFSYEENQKVLENLNIFFEKGKKYTIIGESGSGKSTILKLLLGYYNNYEGRILLDGKEYRNFSPESIRRNIAVIPQNVFLFEDTLYNNITLYQDYPKEKILKAIKKAGLEILVEKLEYGLETVITENGNNLSGGERQRIAVARALLTQKEIVLMDEATANVDRNTAVAIERAVLEEKSITCISVTHHFMEENLQLFDKIFHKK